MPAIAKRVIIGDSIPFKCAWSSIADNCANVAIPGNTTAQMWSRFDNDVIARSPTAVLIWGGINDIAQSQQISPLMLLYMARAAEAAAVHAEALVGTILPILHWDSSYPYTNLAEMNARVQAWNGSIRGMCADEGYTLLDFAAAFRDGSGNVRSELYLPDGIHPNAAGRQVILDTARELFLDAVPG